jgi:polyhydroxybutyrate depolymerase
MRVSIYSLVRFVTLLVAACSSSSDTPGDAGNESSESNDGSTNDDSVANNDAVSSDAGNEATGPATCPVGAMTGSPSGGTLTITVVGNPVNLLVRVPPNYVATAGSPFVMVFAPAGLTASNNEQFTGLTSEAMKRGYIIAYADNSLFNSTQLPQEVQQSAAAIPAVTAKWCVDPKRIYATGHSNGGSLSEVIGVEQLVTFAAISPSASGVPASVMQSFGCPKAPLPVLEVHSSGDQLFPLAQGFGADVAKFWAGCDGCNATPSAPDSTGCIQYTGCSGGAEVDYCQGTAAHGVWPGRDKQIFDFFDRFTAP